MTRLHKDRVMSAWLSIAIVGLAVQVAALSAYIPLEIIGPDPWREFLLLWVMPTWIVVVTVGATLLLRKAFRKWFA